MQFILELPKQSTAFIAKDAVLRYTRDVIDFAKTYHSVSDTHRSGVFNNLNTYLSTNTRNLDWLLNGTMKVTVYIDDNTLTVRLLDNKDYVFFVYNKSQETNLIHT